jgi:hypothetical protein
VAREARNVRQVGVSAGFRFRSREVEIEVIKHLWRGGISEHVRFYSGV